MNSIELRIIERFDKYHKGEDVEEMCSLYEDLIDEEIGETFRAILSGDIVESFDGLGDVYWVILGGFHYYMQSSSNNSDEIANQYYSRLRLIRKLMGDKFEPVMEEIIKSNFSKSKDTQSNGKIKKGKNFVKPNILSALGLDE